MLDVTLNINELHHHKGVKSTVLSLKGPDLKTE